MTGMDEQELVRLLSAPATAAELADEAAYRAMFRRVGPSVGLALVRPGGARTAVRRVGMSTSLAVVFAVAGAGVAAAYSSHLPAPVQSAVHRVLAPIGVPPAQPERVVARPETEPVSPPTPQAPSPQPGVEPSPHGTPSASPESSPSASPSATPSETPSTEVSPTASGSPDATETASPSASPTESPTESPTDSPTAPAPLPTETPSPTESSPTPSPTESPTPTAPLPVPEEVTLSAAVGHRVAPGQSTVLFGVVSDESGVAVPDVEVVLQEDKGLGWVDVAEAPSTDEGAVSLSSPAADRTARYRFKVGAVRSASWRLALQPTVTATARTPGATTTVNVRARGGQPGSPVLLQVRRNGQVMVVASGVLDSGGSVGFTIPTPTAETRYTVRLLPTDAHAGARTRVVVVPTAPSASPSASTSITPSP